MQGGECSDSNSNSDLHVQCWHAFLEMPRRVPETENKIDRKSLKGQSEAWSIDPNSGVGALAGSSIRPHGLRAPHPGAEAFGLPVEEVLPDVLTATCLHRWRGDLGERCHSSRAMGLEGGGLQTCFGRDVHVLYASRGQLAVSAISLQALSEEPHAGVLAPTSELVSHALCFGRRSQTDLDRQANTSCHWPSSLLEFRLQLCS